jgi:hypothetical protein
MEKTKKYGRIKFSSRVVRAAIHACRFMSNSNDERTSYLTVGIGEVSWTFDSVEEFLTEYSSDKVSHVMLQIFWRGTENSLCLTIDYQTRVSVSSKSRNVIESVFSIFEEAGPEDKKELFPGDDICIFIGHGRDGEWQRLKSHLQDKHRLNIVAYETGARAGHAIRDILETMSQQASFALLVLTGEDRMEGGLRARQNVIHECGLFPGRLGFDRAILLVEEGVELASNFDGIQQLRFEKGRITEVFGDVIATLKREFGRI